MVQVKILLVPYSIEKKMMLVELYFMVYTCSKIKSFEGVLIMHQCCEHCFRQDDIRNYIIKDQKIGDCYYCGSKNVAIKQTKKVGLFIRESLDKAYELLGEDTGSMYDSEEDMYIGRYGEETGVSVRDILFDEEDIFNYNSGTEQLFVDLFHDSTISYEDIKNGEIDRYENIEADLFVVKNALYGSESIAEHYEWEKFKHLVKYYNRFFDINPKEKKRDELLEALKPYFEKMAKVLPQGSELYRVRKMDIQSANYLNSLDIYKELSPAPPKYATNNRMSPAGISYLYVATQPQTAYLECRLHDGDCAVQGKFVTKKSLNILDLSLKVNFRISNSIFSAEYNQDALWINEFLNQFEDEISRPVNPNKDRSYEYIATQMVAEYVRMLGYDGIKYRSSISPEGQNYVFFCGPNRKISGDIYDYYGIMSYEELRYFTDWFYIDDVKAVRIREKVISSICNEDIFFASNIDRSDINASNVFGISGGNFTYSSLIDIKRFIEDIPKCLLKDGYGIDVSEDIRKHLLESIEKEEGETHNFSCMMGFGFLNIHIDSDEYTYFNGKDFDDYIKPCTFSDIK